METRASGATTILLLGEVDGIDGVEEDALVSSWGYFKPDLFSGVAKWVWFVWFWVAWLGLLAEILVSLTFFKAFRTFRRFIFHSYSF